MPVPSSPALAVSPNFFIFGAAKCGTTSLHRRLQSHPQISMSSIKEPNFFTGDHPQFESPLRWGRVSDPDEYSALFEPTRPVRGEASTSYSEYPFFDGVIDRIHEASPEANFVYLVRDPIERVQAHYMQRVAAGATGKLTALTEDGDPENELVCASRYMTQIGQLTGRFPAERILVIDQSDLRGNPTEQVVRILDFLGLESDSSDSADAVELNRSADKTRVPPFARRLARSRPVARAIETLPGRGAQMLRASGRRALGRPVVKPGVPPDLRDRLEETFAPEVDDLRDFTSQAFTGWSM